MAVLTLSHGTPTENSVVLYWSITGMSSSGISLAGLCRNQPTGQTASPGIISSKSVSSTSASGSVTLSKSSYPDGYISVYGFGKDTAGKYWSAGGNKSISWTWPTVASVTKWSWSVANGPYTEGLSDGAQLTQNALAALSGNTSQWNWWEFSHLVWNDLVYKVKEVLDSKGLSWSTSYGKYCSYSATLMSSNDTELTAERFNALRYNIGSRYSTGIDDKSPGDKIMAWYFTTLTNCINDWIDA